MLSQLTRCAKNLWARLSSAASQLLRRLTEPARPNLVTGTLADLPRSRAELLAENALLRQQLIVLRRNTKTPRLTWRERYSLVFLARWVPNWKQVLQIIQPDTLLRWHREGFRLFSQVCAAEISPPRADATPAPGAGDDCLDRADGA